MKNGVDHTTFRKHQRCENTGRLFMRCQHHRWTLFQPGYRIPKPRRAPRTDESTQLSAPVLNSASLHAGSGRSDFRGRTERIGAAWFLRRSAILPPLGIGGNRKSASTTAGRRRWWSLVPRPATYAAIKRKFSKAESPDNIGPDRPAGLRVRVIADQLEDLESRPHQIGMSPGMCRPLPAGQCCRRLAIQLQQLRVLPPLASLL